MVKNHFRRNRVLENKVIAKLMQESKKKQRYNNVNRVKTLFTKTKPEVSFYV